MEELNKFYTKIQMYLLKTCQEYGDLKSISSGITNESINQIKNICDSIVNIFEMCDIPVKETATISNEKCVQSYKYLLLNTRFKNQERLAEDILCGHLVDMCPPLSPFLFIHVLWKLEYEKILIESLLHMPFDLCTELLSIVAKCVDKLPFERSILTIYQLIYVIYAKFLQMGELGIQSSSVDESIEQMLKEFEEFLVKLDSTKLPFLTEASGLIKCEREGLMFKRLLGTVRKCLENKSTGISISKDQEKMYNVTCGREAFIKLESNFMQDTVRLVSEQLIQLLSTKIKEIDCNLYIGWAELDDDENRMISLQRSIGIECFYFVELITKEPELFQDNSLIECLKNLSSKPNPSQSNFVLSLQELCCAITDGKKELMQELLCRYKEWDRSVIDFVHDNRLLLDKKECLILLDYLSFILTQPIEEDMKEYNYTLVTEILLFRKLSDLYEIVMMNITKNDGKNYLESPHTEEAFHDFISTNTNLRLSSNLKTILLFLLKNPKMILTILLKITIGHSRYENIMVSPNDLLLLASFMQIKNGDNQTLSVKVLRDICRENSDWNAKKFIDFLKVMLSGSVFKVDELINHVFIPYLQEDTFNASNINSILTSIRKFQVTCTKDTNVKDLIIVLAKRMSYLRKKKSISKYTSSEIFVKISRILHYFLDMKSYPASIKREIIDAVESVIEPIDKLHFSSLWYFMQKGVSVIDILEDYQRRCFSVLNRLKEEPKVSENLNNYLWNLGLSREDFLRHLIVRSTEEEYQILGFELTVLFWFAFGWNDEVDAYNHFLRLTVEACCLCLEYPFIGEKDIFPFLFKSFIRFCTIFISLEGVENFDDIYRSLIINIAELDESITRTSYANLFNVYLTRLNNRTPDDAVHPLQEVVNILHNFSDQCLELNNEPNSHETCQIPPTPKIHNFYITHKVISACIKVPASEAYECIRRVNELFDRN